MATPPTKSRKTNHGTCALVMAGFPSACIAAAICAFSTMPNITKSITFNTRPATRPPISTFCMLIFPIEHPLEREDSIEPGQPAAATLGNRTRVVKSQHVQDRDQSPHAVRNGGHATGHNPFSSIDYQVEVVGAGRKAQRRLPDVVAEGVQGRGRPGIPVARDRDRPRRRHPEADDDGVAPPPPPPRGPGPLLQGPVA